MSPDSICPQNTWRAGRQSTRKAVRGMINETSIKCFLSLTKTLSFTETARDMYMTQQSVSKYIARLEDELGFRLFTRTRHYVAMTRAGEVYRELFEGFQADFRRAGEELRRYYEEIRGGISLGYLEMLEISDGIAEALKLIRRDSPSLSFSGEKQPQYELIERFNSRELDIIITYKEFAPKSAGIKKVDILTTPLVLLVSPENPGVKDGATVDTFKNEPFIKAASSHETVSETRERARRQCRELGFTPSEIIIAPNIESAYMATELGQGVFISTMLSRLSLHSSLTCYPTGKTEKLQCFWHEDTENTAIEKFAVYLEEIYREKEGR